MTSPVGVAGNTDGIRLRPASALSCTPFETNAVSKPSAIKLRRASRVLEVTFDDDTQFSLPFELLRVYSPSAEVRGHGEGQRILQTGKKHVNVTSIEPVGNYAIRLAFDDGHNTGIYAFDYLRELGANQEKLWREYELELQKANASRLPAIAIGQWQPMP